MNSEYPAFAIHGEIGDSVHHGMSVSPTDLQADRLLVDAVYALPKVRSMITLCLVTSNAR